MLHWPEAVINHRKQLSNYQPIAISDARCSQQILHFHLNLQSPAPFLLNGFSKPSDKVFNSIKYQSTIAAATSLDFLGKYF